MPKRSKQLEFVGAGLKKPDVRFGGSLLGKSNPKRKRSLDSKRPIHLVLRANQSGMRSPRTHVGVNRLMTSTAQKYGVTIYEYANVGNHLHAVIRLKRLDRWAAFIRELTGRIAWYVKE